MQQSPSLPPLTPWPLLTTPTLFTSLSPSLQITLQSYRGPTMFVCASLIQLSTMASFHRNNSFSSLLKSEQYYIEQYYIHTPYFYLSIPQLVAGQLFPFLAVIHMGYRCHFNKLMLFLLGTYPIAEVPAHILAVVLVCVFGFYTPCYFL